MKLKKKILWITETALFLALLIVVQFVTKSMSQLVTGSLVNFILIAATATAGLYSGLFVALVSPFLAFLLGIGPVFIQIPPAIAIGNAIIVVLCWLFFNIKTEKFVLRTGLNIVGVVSGAALKALFLWLSVTKVILPYWIPGIKAPQVATMSAMFSTPQLITALIGGALAVLAYPVFKKIRNANR